MKNKMHEISVLTKLMQDCHSHENGNPLKFTGITIQNNN